MSDPNEEIRLGLFGAGCGVGVIGLVLAGLALQAQGDEKHRAGYFEGLAVRANSTTAVIEKYEPTHQPRAVYGTDAREYCIHGQVFIFSNDGMMQGLVDGVKYEPVRCKEE